MSSTKRASSPSEPQNGAAGPFKKSRQDPSDSAKPQSLHAWLHPDLPSPITTNSPPLHYSSSTFIAFSLSFLPPQHVRNEVTLAKEARRMVKELNVGQIADRAMEDDDGAFEGGEGRVVSLKGKERAREPDHRMWAVRTLCLKEGCDGTGGEDDYQLLETYNDDGEKFGGERLLRVLKDERAVDILTICCRWYGGDMIGPIRFQHIGFTAKTSLHSLLILTRKRDLREALKGLDEEISALRADLPGSQGQTNGSPAGPAGKTNGAAGGEGKGKYDDVDDIGKLERLVTARERTKSTLESKVSWAASEAPKETSDAS